MISIKKADNSFKENNNITDNAYICTDKDKILGIVEYKYENESLVLKKINSDDLSIADGLVRQTMSNALDEGCKICVFDKEIGEQLFKLKIIKDNTQKSIDILGFFIKLNCF